MTAQSHALVRAFLEAMSAGDLPGDLLTDDMVGWTVSSNTEFPREKYQGAAKLVAAVFDGGNHYEVQAITAEGDRAAADVRASGRLIDGQTYANRYVFLFRFRDGKIARIDEFFDPVPMREKLAPLMQQVMARMQPPG